MSFISNQFNVSTLVGSFLAIALVGGAYYTVPKDAPKPAQSVVQEQEAPTSQEQAPQEQTAAVELTDVKEKNSQLVQRVDELETRVDVLDGDVSQIVTSSVRSIKSDLVDRYTKFKKLPKSQKNLVRKEVLEKFESEYVGPTVAQISEYTTGTFDEEAIEDHILPRIKSAAVIVYAEVYDSGINGQRPVVNVTTQIVDDLLRNEYASTLQDFAEVKSEWYEEGWFFYWF